MDPNVWGPKLWFMMHTISLNYPENPTIQDKQNNQVFFNNLQNIIPCDLCKQHYSEYLKTHPIDPHLSNKMSLVKWVLDVHNDVSKRLGKPTWSLNKLLTHYENSYKSNSGKTSTKLLIVIGFVILFILGYYLFKKYRCQTKLQL